MYRNCRKNKILKQNLSGTDTVDFAAYCVLQNLKNGLVKYLKFLQNFLPIESSCWVSWLLQLFGTQTPRVICNEKITKGCQ